jgi:hypothetical protein
MGGGGDGMMVQEEENERLHKVGAGGHHQETKPQLVHKERLHEVCDGGRGDISGR